MRLAETALPVIRPLLALLFTLAVLRPAHAAPPTVSRPAEAPEPELAAQLTRRGRVALDGQARFQWSNDQPTIWGNIPEWRLGVHPSLVYYVRDNIGVGGAVGGAFTRGRTSNFESWTDREASVGLQSVVAFPLAARWSLMLRPFMGYVRQWSEREAPGANDGPVKLRQTLDYMRFMVSTPFVFACSKYLGVGMGPELLVDVFLHRSASPTEIYPKSGKGARVQLGFNVGLYASF
jgi:hypothetical protein